MRVAASVLAALVLAGCGEDEAPRVTAVAPVQTTPHIDPEILPPASVPRTGDRAANPAHLRVLRRWLAALRRGDVERAARFFALPSRFQNGTPVLTIDSQLERIAINESLPCGAVAETVRGAPGGWMVITFRLTERPGADCGRGTGRTTGGAVRVRSGRISDWFRLYEDDDPPPAASQIDPGGQDA